MTDHPYTVTDHILAAVLAIAPESRPTAVRALVDAVAVALISKGFSDEQILQGKVEFGQLLLARLLDLHGGLQLRDAVASTLPADPGRGKKRRVAKGPTVSDDPVEHA